MITVLVTLKCKDFQRSHNKHRSNQLKLYKVTYVDTVPYKPTGNNIHKWSNIISIIGTGHGFRLPVNGGNSCSIIQAQVTRKRFRPIWSQLYGSSKIKLILKTVAISCSDCSANMLSIMISARQMGRVQSKLEKNKLTLEPSHLSKLRKGDKVSPNTGPPRQRLLTPSLQTIKPLQQLVRWLQWALA